MENQNNAFINDDKKAVYGCVNGILMYDLIWPWFGVLILKLFLQSNYANMVDNHYYTMNTNLMIITSLITIAAAIFIAKPKCLLNAYKKIDSSNVKFIFKCFLLMFVANYIYNLILLLSGVPIGGGNANQNTAVEMMNNSRFLSFIAMVIIAPVLEEITYRYFLFGGIAKYNRKWAIVISGFVFMCVHAVASFSQPVDSIFREILLLPPYMFSGMVLAYSYDKTENLAIPTSIHTLNNLISFIISTL